MSSNFNNIPEAFYGVIDQDQYKSEIEEVADQVRRLGYAILDSDFTNKELQDISNEFNSTRKNYLITYGEDRLRSAKELHTMRAPLTHGGSEFIQLAKNLNLSSVLSMLIVGKYILNQQNGIINPPGESNNPISWHRDLPYQHYVSSSPLALNALFCIDDFTLENGSTFVLPATHKEVNFPSTGFINRNAIQVEAKAGQYILMDCMLFHSGGPNRTDQERRAVNHVFTIPYFKQQINIPKNISASGLSEEEMDLFGFNYEEPGSINQYLTSREKKGDE